MCSTQVDCTERAVFSSVQGDRMLLNKKCHKAGLLQCTRAPWTRGIGVDGGARGTKGLTKEHFTPTQSSTRHSVELISTQLLTRHGVKFTPTQLLTGRSLQAYGLQGWLLADD